MSLGPSLFQQVKASRSLYSFLKPVANAYANLSGYRKVGLKYDDILQEESPIVQKVSGWRRSTPMLAAGDCHNMPHVCVGC